LSPPQAEKPYNESDFTGEKRGEDGQPRQGRACVLFHVREQQPVKLKDDAVACRRFAVPDSPAQFQRLATFVPFRLLSAHIATPGGLKLGHLGQLLTAIGVTPDRTFWRRNAVRSKYRRPYDFCLTEHLMPPRRTQGASPRNDLFAIWPVHDRDDVGQALA
jgi:hypothetical protein